MLVWVVEVKTPEGKWIPWISYVARYKWMFNSRLKLKVVNCPLMAKETRIMKYNLTKKKESNVNSTKKG